MELQLLPFSYFPAEHFCRLYHSTGDGSGGRCRIRTYDFHRVKVTLYR